MAGFPLEHNTPANLDCLVVATALQQGPRLQIQEGGRNGTVHKHPSRSLDHLPITFPPKLNFTRKQRCKIFATASENFECIFNDDISLSVDEILKQQP